MWYCLFLFFTWYCLFLFSNAFLSCWLLMPAAHNSLCLCGCLWWVHTDECYRCATRSGVSAVGIPWAYPGQDGHPRYVFQVTLCDSCAHARLSDWVWLSGQFGSFQSSEFQIKRPEMYLKVYVLCAKWCPTSWLGSSGALTSHLCWYLWWEPVMQSYTFFLNRKVWLSRLKLEYTSIMQS